jgi:Fur family ferric uptake transcriptional regulator
MPQQKTISGEPTTETQARRQETLRKALAKRGLRHTRQREILTDIFFGSNEHFSLDELLEAARARDSGIGYATVYRTLKLLTELGLAHELRFGEGQTRYEAADVDHHDHLLCTRCGAIVEFEEPEIETLQIDVARRHGFRLETHRMELYGVCARCQRAELRKS